MHRSQAWLLLIIRVILDVAAVVLAFIAAYCVHFWVSPSGATMRFLTAYYKLLIIVIPMWLVTFNLSGLYKYNIEPLPKLTGPDRFLRIISGVTLAVLVTYGVTYIWPEYYLIRQAPRPLILYVWLFGLLLIGLVRLGIGYCSKRLEQDQLTGQPAKK